MSAAHTPGPWQVTALSGGCSISVSNAATPSRTGVTVAFVHPEDDHHEALREAEANARLIAAAPLLLGEAQVLRCLATSPRFAAMTVADALAELSANGCGHDGGAALAKVQS